MVQWYSKINYKEFEKVINTRRSIRVFTNEKIPDENYEDIKKVFSIGASGVITNRPKVAYELLAQMGKR